MCGVTMDNERVDSAIMCEWSRSTKVIIQRRQLRSFAVRIVKQVSTGSAEEASFLGGGGAEEAARSEGGGSDLGRGVIAGSGGW